MADDRQPGFDKLNESNWPVWKLQIMNYLMARELWDLCDGTEVALVQGQNETQAAFATREKAHKVRKARVMSILGQTISMQQKRASLEVTIPATLTHQLCERDTLEGSEGTCAAMGVANLDISMEIVRGESKLVKGQ